MLLPAGEQAVVEDAKLPNYVLNPEHPVGRHHAELFERLLGITRLNCDVLKEQLLRAAVSVAVAAGRPSPYGEKFEMRFDSRFAARRGHDLCSRSGCVSMGTRRRG